MKKKELLKQLENVSDENELILFDITGMSKEHIVQIKDLIDKELTSFFDRRDYQPRFKKQH